MDADWTFWLALIIFSIWRRRDATKRDWRFLWLGCDTTTNMKKTRSWMPRKRTHSRIALATRAVQVRVTEGGDDTGVFRASEHSCEMQSRAVSKLNPARLCIPLILRRKRLAAVDGLKSVGQFE